MKELISRQNCQNCNKKQTFLGNVMVISLINNPTTSCKSYWSIINAKGKMLLSFHYHSGL